MIRSIKIFFLVLFLISTKIYGHCQVPCGIYDAVRIVQIEEDITAIRKAMNMINDLMVNQMLSLSIRFQDGCDQRVACSKCSKLF